MTKTFKATHSKVYQACKDALTELEIVTRYSNKKRGVIKAETDFSLFSWGEEIHIDLIEKREGETEVIVRSSSKAQLIDWGRNEANERNVLREISRLLKDK